MKYVLVGIIVLVILGVGGFAYLGQQSQDGRAAGVIEGRLAPCPSSPNCVSSEAGEPEEKQVAPLPLDDWAKLPQAVTSMGGVVTAQSKDYISAEFTSPTFGFVDDLEFLRTDDAVQVRSASRVGYSDRGVNSARVAALRDMLGG